MFPLPLHTSAFQVSPGCWAQQKLIRLPGLVHVSDVRMGTTTCSYDQCLPTTHHHVIESALAKGLLAMAGVSIEFGIRGVFRMARPNWAFSPAKVSSAHDCCAQPFFFVHYRYLSFCSFCFSNLCKLHDMID